jgi:hypothetical protein
LVSKLLAASQEMRISPAVHKKKLSGAEMKTVDDLIAGYRRFRAGVYAEQVQLYRELGEGQDPDVMLIACADSRAEPSDIFNAAPGQMFVVRNVANLVQAAVADTRCGCSSPAVLAAARLTGEIVIGDIGPVVGTHAGRGTIGIAFHEG